MNLLVLPVVTVMTRPADSDSDSVTKLLLELDSVKDSEVLHWRQVVPQVSSGAEYSWLIILLKPVTVRFLIQMSPAGAIRRRVTQLT
jgi:hypothetical protein